MQRTQWCESRLEFDHLYWLESSKEVKGYQTQPVTLAFRVNKRVREYSPDVLIEHTDGSLIFREVKPQSRLDEDTSLVDKLIAFRGTCAARGVGFEVVTEAQIQRPPLGILRSLYHYAHVPPPRESLARFASALDGQESLTLAEAYEHCEALELPAWYVLSWMWQGDLDWPAFDALSPDLPITVAPQRS